jgi:tetratricopeptide (TPR) repeat protein
MTEEAARGGPTRGRRARRTRRWVLAGAAGVAALSAAAVLLRPRPSTYTPGADAGASGEITRDLARSRPAGFPDIRFVDAAADTGLVFRHFHGTRSTQLPEDMGSGLAWGDYDGDGDPDLFLVNEDGPLTLSPDEARRSPAHAALFRNDGGRFTDVTETAGLDLHGCGMGAAWGDYDGDGDLDLVVTRFGRNALFRNDGGGHFTDVSDASGVGAPEGFWSGAAWGDYDRDGDLDLYVAGYVKYRYDEALAGKGSQQYAAVVPFTLNPSSYPPERNLLLRNDGGVFHDVAAQAGVENLTGRSLSAAWADFDGDGWPDLYVANDISDNAMYRNLGNGRFEDVSHAAWVADYRGAMGLGVGDWDNDGDLDIFIAHWIAQENALYDNQARREAAAPQPMRFLDIADQVGLGQIALDFVGWGCGFFDFDNDGREDLFVVNGSTFQREDDPGRLVPMRDLLFWNAGTGTGGGFFEAGDAAGEALAVENVGRGAACADFDGDGDLDIAINVNGGDVRLLRNDGGDRQRSLRVVLRGHRSRDAAARTTGGRRALRTTTFATGAVVRLTANGVTQMREIGAGPSYLSQSPPGEAHFGLGAAASVERLEIDWPDGARQEFTDLPAGGTLTLSEGGSPVLSVAPAVAPAASASPARTTAPADHETVILFWRTLGEATAARTAGDCAAAIPIYRRALALHPGHEDALYYLGQCLQALGRTDEAHRALVDLVTVNPSSSRGHLALGFLALWREGGPDLDSAQHEFEQAHGLNKEESGAMLQLGEVALVRGEGERASEWLRAALHTNPRNLEAAFLLGYLEWHAGDAAAAARRCGEAIAMAAPPAAPQGVKSEGDRQAAAPPLTSPMGRTLFSDFSDRLRSAGPGDGSAAATCASSFYPAVDERIDALRRRTKTPAA